MELTNERTPEQKTLETASLLTLFFQEQEKILKERVFKSETIRKIIYDEFEDFIQEYDPQSIVEDLLDEKTTEWIDNEFFNYADEMIAGRVYERIDKFLESELENIVGSKRFSKIIKGKVEARVNEIVSDLSFEVSLNN